MPIRKALSVDGEHKAVNYLLCGEYEMTNTFWSKLQKKYNLSKNEIYSALKWKRRTWRISIPAKDIANH